MIFVCLARNNLHALLLARCNPCFTRETNVESFIRENRMFSYPEAFEAPAEVVLVLAAQLETCPVLLAYNI